METKIAVGQRTQHIPESRSGSSLNWLVVNPEGKLLAVLDSESEAHFFTRNRGHANGSVYFQASCDYAVAPELLEAAKPLLKAVESYWVLPQVKPFYDAMRAVIAKAEKLQS